MTKMKALGVELGHTIPPSPCDTAYMMSYDVKIHNQSGKGQDDIFST